MAEYEEPSSSGHDDRDFRIEYEVMNHGWAEVSISCDGTKVSREVSYLHDSLLELARMARNLKDGKSNATAVFMDEPGELQLHIDCHEDIARITVRKYRDWASWGWWSIDDFEVLLECSCTRSRIVGQITDLLWKIYEEIGPKKYRQLWESHEFPVDDFESLTE